MAFRRASLLALFCGGLLVIGILLGAAWELSRAGLQQDFAAYWVAGVARRHGLDPYLNAAAGTAGPVPWDGVAVFTHSRFLYPPLVADLLRPMARMPYAIAKTAWSVAAVAAVLGALVVVARDARAAGAQRGLARGLAPVAAAVVFFPVYLLLERGQIDGFVLLLLALAWAAQAHVAAAGPLLAGAVLLKPALAVVLPFLLVLRRGRWLAATVLSLVALAVVTVAVSGPALTLRYAREVLPRAARYGEGGTEAMLLPDETLARLSSELESGRATLDGRTYPQTVWDVAAGASLPRLLAPSGPNAAAFLLPYPLLAAALAWAGRRAHRDHLRAALLFWGAAVLSVITSPTGWAMSLVLALPLVPVAAARAREGRLGRTAAMGIGAGLVVCALPAGTAVQSVAGAMLVLAGVALELASKPSAS